MCAFLRKILSSNMESGNCDIGLREATEGKIAKPVNQFCIIYSIVWQMFHILFMTNAMIIAVSRSTRDFTIRQAWNFWTIFWINVIKKIGEVFKNYYLREKRKWNVHENMLFLCIFLGDIKFRLQIYSFTDNWHCRISIKTIRYHGIYFPD